MKLTPHSPSDTAVSAKVGQPGSGPAVIALATYRRPTDLARCLGSLVAEIDRFRTRRRAADEHLDVSVLVVDNDPEASGRATASAFGDLVRYLVEPAPGISAARNRALEAAAAARTLIFVDDDEEVTPGWLTNLFDAYARWRPAAVAGRVVSEFGAPLDPWIEAGGFFRRRTLPTGSAITTAATNNLLLDLDSVRRLGLRFDDVYGLTGGGDTDFTRRLAQHGAAMIWSDDAVVIDHVPAERSTREWVCRRAKRTGNSEVVVALRLASGPVTRLAVRTRAAARGVGRVTAGSVGRGIGRLTGSLGLHARSTKAVYRGRGMVAGAFGRSVAEYTRSVQLPALRVLTSFPRPGARTNPYIRQLAMALDDTKGVTVVPFSWSGAVTGRYDVVHLHWPEILVQGGSLGKGMMRRALVMVLIARWTFGRIGVVRTVHNRAPHEVQSRLNAVQLRRLDALVDVRITLNAVDSVSGDDTTIPHGHYVDWYADTPKRPAVAGRIAFAGLVRQYKNVGELIAAFAEVSSSSIGLRIVGHPADAALAAELTAQAAADGRVSFDLRHLDDAELVGEITAATLVALPYRDMHNSGAALLALSLRRPVLVPDNEVTRGLAREVGSQWVMTFTGPLKAADLVLALTRAESILPDERPDLSARSWASVGARHLEAYRAAASRGRRQASRARREGSGS